MWPGWGWNPGSSDFWSSSLPTELVSVLSQPVNGTKDHELHDGSLTHAEMFNVWFMSPAELFNVYFFSQAELFNVYFVSQVELFNLYFVSQAELFNVFFQAEMFNVYFVSQAEMFNVYFVSQAEMFNVYFVSQTEMFNVYFVNVFHNDDTIRILQLTSDTHNFTSEVNMTLGGQRSTLAKKLLVWNET
ncbi:hypothetical protein DPMN_165750 [Dreissena polymorpha]|uniref:Uncharacterized protein n=1 Tax=Dreissena polymorpha TaxID=45954 RepID=A0A9D4IXA2_DREPO|nr:hypothetical protein DPMN_165750 [Dreissena polymorpha]